MAPNSNDATLAQDDLVKSSTVLKLNGNNLITRPCFPLTFQATDSFWRYRN